MVTSCSDEPISKKDNAPWDYRNNPHHMDSSALKQHRYKMKFSDLPLKGTLTRLPWSGDYWPTHKGGITYRWHDQKKSDKDRYSYNLDQTMISSKQDLSHLSPAEKFDLFMGHSDYPLTHYERMRTKILHTVENHPDYQEDFKIPEWEGLCHAWAPATLAFSEPQPVTLQGKTGMMIPFGSSDIKALLTYFLHLSNPKTYFLGRRCNIDIKKLKDDYQNKLITYDDFVEQKKQCDDTHAGAFHVVLTNQISLLDQGFIADITRDQEVWNQSVFAYESQIIDRYKGSSPGAAPGTTEEVVIETQMDYVDEVSHSWYPSSEYPYNYKTYRYRLELDKNGYIIGGEWDSDEADRPDFLWKQELPEFSGYFDQLKEIYESSTNQTSQTLARKD